MEIKFSFFIDMPDERSCELACQALTALMRGDEATYGPINDNLILDACEGSVAEGFADNVFPDAAEGADPEAVKLAGTLLADALKHERARDAISDRVEDGDCLSGLRAEIRSDGIRKTLVISDGHGTDEQGLAITVGVVQALVSHFNLRPVGWEWTYAEEGLGSSAFNDYGGGAFMVTADEVRSMETAVWLQEQVDDLWLRSERAAKPKQSFSPG